MQSALRSLIAMSLIGGAALYICPKNGTRQVLKLLLTAILTAAVNGEDPATYDPDAACTGDCCSCGGCH